MKANIKTVSNSILNFAQQSVMLTSTITSTIAQCAWMFRGMAFWATAKAAFPAVAAGIVAASLANRAVVALTGKDKAGNAKHPLAAAAAGFTAYVGTCYFLLPSSLFVITASVVAVSVVLVAVNNAVAVAAKAKAASAFLATS